MGVGCVGRFSAIVYDWFEETVVGGVVAFSKAVPDACLEMLLLDDEEECNEVREVLGRRLRFAKAVLVLSRARAAIECRLVFD